MIAGLKKLVSKFSKKQFLLVFLFLLSFTFLFGLRVNYNSYHYSNYDADQYHTVHQGLNLLVNGEVENFRVQEGARWIARLSYPYALIKMNTVMGGNVFLDDWDYPGHQYVVKNYVSNYENFNHNLIDINLRDLFQNMKLIYVLLVFLSFLPLLYLFFKKGYYFFVFGLVVLLGINTQLLYEQSIFYVEPALLACINLLIFTFFYYLDKQKMTWKSLVFCSFLLAFSISVKFTALPLIALSAINIFYLDEESKKRFLKFIYLLLGLVGFYLLINFPAFSSLSKFNLFIHDFTSNFWQYAAGSNYEYTVAPGLNYLSLMIRQLEGLLGYALYLLPVVWFFGLYYANKKERILLLSFSAVLLFVIFALTGQRIYMVRNLIPFYPLFLLVFLISLDIIYRGISYPKGILFQKKKKIMVFSLVIAIFWLFGIVNHGQGLQAYKEALIPCSKIGFLEEIDQITKTQKYDKIYSVGFDLDFFENTDFVDGIIRVNNAPQNLNNVNYEEYQSLFAELSDNSVLMVNRIGNNSQLTNYILPKYFNHNLQYGNYYLFFNN